LKVIEHSSREDRGVTNAQKIYDFPLPKVEEKLVSFLKTRRGESTVADMIAGTGLPKYQVEVAAKAALGEYAGRLKATESGELLYYFPNGMRSTVRGFGPSARRFLKGFARGALKVLSFLFKVWIVGMLVGYFVAFVALAVLAVVAAAAASVASRDDRSGGRGRDGGGLGGMGLVIRVFELILRMWFWSSLLNGPGQGGFRGRDTRKPREGRAFYKSVFGFVFGEGDPNPGWDEAERKYVLAYIRSHKGVITLEELMALTGRENDEANQLINRLLLEFEGEPGVTDNGTVVYSFPEIMRTSETGKGTVPLENPSTRNLAPFSANKKKTNGWIIFFNAVNLAFGSYFLLISVMQGAAALVKGGPALYQFTGNLLSHAGISPVPFLAIVLGVVPVAFSIIFFLVPLLRKISLDRRNARMREDELRKRIYARVLASPALVSPADITPDRDGLDPKDFPAARRRIIERLAAVLGGEPIAQEKGAFAYRFAELERQMGDLQQFRGSIDVKKYAVGKTIFDSGE
jgi:hypothetical protein